jgi:hypothetical protein
MKLTNPRLLQSLAPWLGRWPAVLLLGISVLLGGCIRGSEAWVPDGQAAPPGLDAANFLNVCKNGVCLVYWKNRRPGGELVGGQLVYRDMAYASFEVLDDGRHWIAQSSTRDRAHHSYALLRRDNGVWLAYDFEPRRINRAYLDMLAATGGVTVTESTSLLGLSREVRINNRAALVRWMHDMARLSNAELAAMAQVYTVSAASAQDAQRFMDERATESSRATLLSPDAQPNRLPLTATAGQCPAGLPATVLCTRLESAPSDPVPQVGPVEVLYFQRGDCVHCERMRETLARWQLQLPDRVVFIRTNANWLPNEIPSASVRAYGLTRVPAFVVNRRYRVELAASDAPAVQQALDAVLHLAGEFKR